MRQISQTDAIQHEFGPIAGAIATAMLARSSAATGCVQASQPVIGTWVQRCERTVRGALRALVDAGVIACYRMSDPRGYRVANVYRWIGVDAARRAAIKLQIRQKQKSSAEERRQYYARKEMARSQRLARLWAAPLPVCRPTGNRLPDHTRQESSSDRFSPSPALLRALEGWKRE